MWNSVAVTMTVAAVLGWGAAILAYRGWRRARRQVRRLLRLDGLTGLANRRCFLESVEASVGGVHASLPVSVVFIDCDDFKSLNDTHGHLAGDEVLLALSSLLSEHCRESDLAARMGGDEFAVLMPDADGEVARGMTNKVRSEFQRLGDEMEWRLTLSIGIVTCSSSRIDSTSIVQLADKLMYTAKLNGKDGVEFKTVNGEDACG